MKDTTQRRTRSFGGCITCRLRRIKCDEHHPRCTICTKAGLVCEGYEARLKFVFFEPSSSGAKKAATAAEKKDEAFSRQQLFNEDDRLATSLSLTSRVRLDGVDAILERLDADSVESSHGPFGVFSLKHGTHQAIDPQVTVADVSEEAFDEEISRPDFTFDFDSSCDSSFDVAGLLGKFDIAAIDGDFALSFADNKQNGGTDVTDEPDRLEFSTFQVSNLTPLSHGAHECGSPTPLTTNLSISVNQDCMSTVPSNAHYLLNHYKSQMGKLFSPLRVRKPIWSVLHLPSAMATFSQLTVFGEASHAKSALFYGLLAVSAFNLDKITTNSASNYWWAVGERLSGKARHQLQQACTLELDGPYKSKYKDILIAILNMITIAVVNAQQEEARSYLLNAELFICLRSSLKTHHSRKAKMLHQIYLFLRIIEESTYIYPEGWRPLATPSSKAFFTSMRFPSLRTHALGQGRDIDELCGGNLEHCLLGQPCCTHKFQQLPLFSQIYGIPETLFSLISKITALANEIAALDASSMTKPLPSHLHEASMALEKEVCGWTNEGDSCGASAPEEETNTLPESRAYMPPFIFAIHSATIILFYRRVYNLNPLLLQSQVEIVIDHLVRTEVEKVNSSVVNTAIVWPGFIAAVEALSPALQEKCEGWLRGCAASGGMRNFDLAADVARKVWRERELRADPAFSWVDLVREQRVALVLT